MSSATAFQASLDTKKAQNSADLGAAGRTRKRTIPAGRGDAGESARVNKLSFLVLVAVAVTGVDNQRVVLLKFRVGIILER